MFIGGEHTSSHSAVIYTFVEWVLEKLIHDPAPAEF
jgi:hypothetical protein